MPRCAPCAPVSCARLVVLSLVLVPCSSPAAEWVVERRETLPAPAGVTLTRIDLSAADVKAELHAATFLSRTHSFELMDDPENAYDLASAARARGAVVAVNGGYFHPDRTALGLRVRKGKEIHPLEKAPLLSGILTVTANRMALLRVGEFRRASDLQEAVQCGPFLVDAGRPVADLNATRTAKRTVIVEAAGKRFGLIVTSEITLAQTGAILSTPEAIGGMRITRALNLDGGSSTGMYVASDPPLYLREIRNVRDFVGIVPR